jgi:hypothetical protein
MQNLALTRYIDAMRNTDKRAYAQAVASYGPGSKQAEALRPTLSYMGAQAVRMSIADIVAHIDAGTENRNA